MKRPAASLPSASVKEGQSLSVPVPKVMKRPAKAPKGAVALGSVEPVRRATKHDKDKKNDNDFVHHAHQPEWAAMFLRKKIVSKILMCDEMSLCFCQAQS